MIRRGLGDDLQPVPEGQGPEGSLRFAPHGLRPSGGLTDQAGPQEEARIAARVPDWLRRDVVREDEVSPPVRPSHALNAADRSDRPLDTPWQKQAQMRGTLVHSLLELLPACPADKRKEVARLYLRKSSKALSASDLPAHDLDSVIAGCLALLDDPRFAPLFGPTSRAEVSIAGAVAFGPDRVMRKVSGQIDRLAVLPDRILVADYKTSLSPPKRIEDIDPTHVLQLALYSALLQSLYPDKPVEAFVLYTAGHSLWQVPDHLLDQALS
jgi:ATP-dependent helicase/nuclease subunit A